MTSKIYLVEQLTGVTFTWRSWLEPQDEIDDLKRNKIAVKRLWILEGYEWKLVFNPEVDPSKS